MINTTHLKGHDWVSVGSRTPDKRILILASCRGLPYLNYLDRYNRATGERLQITYINPNELRWGLNGQARNLDVELTRLEQDKLVRNLIEKTDVFIHEYHKNFGMFNTSKVAEKNIYQFGMKAKVDISVPNFHDHFILFQDVVRFNEPLKERAQMDLCEFGGLSNDLVRDITSESWLHVGRFITHCRCSSFPEFGDWFLQTWPKQRLFSTFNHVRNNFTLELFRRMNDEFLRLSLDEAFWRGAATDNLFESPKTPVTCYDVEAFKLQWDERPVSYLFS